MTRHWTWPWLAALLALSAGGCGNFMARRLAQAPNRYPEWFGARAPVTLAFDARWLTNWPAQSLEVGPPPARLSYRLVPPGDYALRVTSTNWLEHGRRRSKFEFRANVPGQPLSPASTPRGTVVLLHCYGNDQTVMLPWALRLAQAGWQCVLVDLRGHGHSTGKMIYYGTQEARDLSRLPDALARDGNHREPVTVVGYSYGAALALRWKASDPRVRAAVAMAPYAELASAVLNVRREYARLIPAACVRAGLKRLPGVLGVEPAELNTTTVLANQALAALFIVGQEDQLTPAPDVRRLRSLAAAPSQLITVDGATHETLPFFLTELSTPVLAWLEGDAARHGLPTTPPAAPIESTQGAR